jgi:hypothetical protein
VSRRVHAAHLAHLSELVGLRGVTPARKVSGVPSLGRFRFGSLSTAAQVVNREADTREAAPKIAVHQKHEPLCTTSEALGLCRTRGVRRLRGWPECEFSDTSSQITSARLLKLGYSRSSLGGQA